MTESNAENLRRAEELILKAEQGGKLNFDEATELTGLTSEIDNSSVIAQRASSVLHRDGFLSESDVKAAREAFVVTGSEEKLFAAKKLEAENPDARELHKAYSQAGLTSVDGLEKSDPVLEAILEKLGQTQGLIRDITPAVGAVPEALSAVRQA